MDLKVLGFALALLAVVLGDGSDLDKCLTLGESDFDSTLAEKNLFVMFFAPWCGHCKRLKPTWNDLCGKMNDEADLKIAAIDCTVEQGLCSKHGVRGYPTLKFFKKGESEGVKYAKGRDLASFEKFIKQTLNPSQVEAEKPIEPCAVPAATKGLLELQDCSFAPAIAEGFSFVKFYAPWCGHCKKLAPAWAELAQKYEDNKEVKIIKLDCTTEKEVCEKYEVGGFPTLVLFKQGKEVERYRGPRALNDLSNFIETKVSGKQQEKSEEKPPKEKGPPRGDCEKPTKDSNGLYEIQDCQFPSHIRQGDSFIKFYAPWCGHCKKLAPTWEKLAQFYADSDQVKITKVDCTVQKEACSANGVKGYPTLMYFRNGKSLGKYSGGRDYDGLKAYIEKQLDAALTDPAKKNAAGSAAAMVALGSEAELKELTKGIKPVVVMFFMAESEQHAQEHKAFSEMMTRQNLDLTFADVDCGVAEALCKSQQAFSDDETFIHLYAQGNTYKFERRNVKKDFNSIKGFIKSSLKKLADQVKKSRDEL